MGQLKRESLLAPDDDDNVDTGGEQPASFLPLSRPSDITEDNMAVPKRGQGQGQGRRHIYIYIYISKKKRGMGRHMFCPLRFRDFFAHLSPMRNEFFFAVLRFASATFYGGQSKRGGRGGRKDTRSKLP